MQTTGLHLQEAQGLKAQAINKQASKSRMASKARVHPGLEPGWNLGRLQDDSEGGTPVLAILGGCCRQGQSRDLRCDYYDLTKIVC